MNLKYKEMELKCNNEYRLIEQSDFDCVGQVAKHCDLPKLCIAINEAQDWDLEPLFCDFWNNIIQISKEIDDYLNQLKIYEECVENEGEDCEMPIEPENYELKVNLLCGGSFEGCKGIKSHKGVKRILTYYSYARYVILNGFNDTPNGLVGKTNDFAIPTPLNELKSFSNKYKDMGYESFKQTKDFLCRNKDVFGFDSCDCKPCGCADGCCDSRTKIKSFKSKIISK